MIILVVFKNIKKQNIFLEKKTHIKFKQIKKKFLENFQKQLENAKLN